MLLAIDVAALQSELRYEASEPDELFPHLYGPLNADAVTEMIPLEPEKDGTFSGRDLA